MTPTPPPTHSSADARTPLLGEVGGGGGGGEGGRGPINEQNFSCTRLSSNSWDGAQNVSSRSVVLKTNTEGSEQKRMKKNYNNNNVSLLLCVRWASN